MPTVQITIREGRSSQQIRALIAGTTEAIVEALDVGPERVRILVNELPPERIAIGGKSVADSLSEGVGP
jgi:4-oxalocrotonate tautomerase